MPVNSYTEYKTEQQSNINFNESFKMGVKAPLVADRIFETFDQADAYVKDPKSSAIPGLILSVIHDDRTESGGKDWNGLYVVVESSDPTDLDIYGKPVLYLKGQSFSQPDWWDDDIESTSHIKHKPTTDYGCFTINPDGTVTETPYAEGYMD